MVFSTRLSLAALGAAALVSAQTPAGSNPSTNTPLDLEFGSTIINPNGQLIPQSLADAGAPTVYSNSSYPGTYTFALVDLLIPYSVVNSSDYATLVPGLGNEPNRTTRLHWWMDEVTQGTDGVFTGKTTLADYEGPQPPKGDIPHDYVLFLFDRPSNFTPIANAEAFYDASTYNGDDRMNFSVPALAAQVGNPIAARYIRVQNAANTNSTNYSNFSTGPVTTGSASSSTSNSTSVSSSNSNSTSASNSTTTSSPKATVSSYIAGNSAGQLSLSVSGLGLAALAGLLLI